MRLDDILKLVQQLLGLYNDGKDRERIELILENVYAMIMEQEEPDDEIIDFMDSIMFDIDYLIDRRGEVVAKSSDEKENKKRRRKMIDMFSQEDF